MKMRKILALSLAMFMLVAFMAACETDKDATTPAPGGTTTPESGAATPDTPDITDEIVELRVLNYIDMSGAGALEEIDVIWKAFEDAHPNIKIIREDGFEDPFHNSVEAYAAAGTLPDVLYAWPSGKSSTLHTKRLLKDLAPLAARDGLASNYIPLAMDPANQLGNYMAILSQGVTATNMFIANMEVLNEVGLTPAKTYSELVAQVPVLREAGYDTILMPNQSTWVMQSCLFSLVVGRFMGEDWHEEILSGAKDFTHPDFVAALDFIKKMYDDGVLPQSSLALDYGEGPGLFATNTAAYYIDGDWRVGAFITDSVTGEALISPERQNNFSITVFPEIDLPGVKFNRSNSAVLGTGWGMNANIEAGSAKEEAAWTLIKWLVGPEIQTFRLRTGGLPTPSWTSIDFASLPLEPLQVSLANLGSEYDRATVVVDGAFDSIVFTPIDDGLQALGLGIQTAQQVAEITQAAFEAWKATLE